MAATRKSAPVKFCTTLRFCFILIASQILVGCGTSNPAPSLSSTSLNGNWEITGNGALGKFPTISLGIFVNGNQVVAQGPIGLVCGSGASALAGTLYLSGQVAPDSTFQLSDAGPRAPGNNQVTISGKVPASGTNVWAGSYSVTSPSNAACVFNHSAAFTAALLTPFDGTYAGTLSTYPPSAGSSTLGVTVAVTQGAATPSINLVGFQSYQWPLAGTIVVSGSSCFTHGTMSATTQNYITGNSSFMTFAMDDGSQVFTGTTFTSTDETAVGVFLSVSGGQCNLTSYAGTLTRQ